MNISELKDWPVERLLPHKPPMILIDRVVAIGADHFEAEVVVRHDSPFCDGEKVAAWVGLEYMAQAVAAYAGAEAIAASRPGMTGFLLGTRHYEPSVPAFAIGSVLRIAVKKVLHQPGGLSVVECSLRRAGEDASLVTANLSVYEVADLAGFLAESKK